MAAAISVGNLYASLGLSSAPLVFDTRSEKDVLESGKLIPGARYTNTTKWDMWVKSLPSERPVVTYCAHGGELSRSAAEKLRASGHQAAYLDGGIDQWTKAQRVTVRARNGFNIPGGSRWITRERPKIDRLACPWLVRRFIDPDALFFYTPAHQVRADAETLKAEPFDIADVTFSHRGARCSFDAFLDEFDLHDPIIDAIADIVRAADTGEPGRSPQAHGLLAISLGLSANIPDDILLLEQAMPIYDALYAWCKLARDEKHSWPQKTY